MFSSFSDKNVLVLTFSFFFNSFYSSDFGSIPVRFFCNNDYGYIFFKSIGSWFRSLLPTIGLITKKAEEASEEEFGAEFVGIDRSAADASGVHGTDNKTSEELHTSSQGYEDRRPEPKPFHTQHSDYSNK